MDPLMLAARRNIRSLLEQFNIPYKAFPFDEDLCRECVEEGRRRGYPLDGDRAQKYLRLGVTYAANASGHIPHLPTQIWVAFYATYTILVDDVRENFLSELPDLYQFHDRFIRREPQLNAFLDALADVMRRAPECYQPVVSQLMTTSTLNFVTANLLEHETKSMKISSAAQQYATYQRSLSAGPEAAAFMVFRKDIPFQDYIQAIPELMVFTQDVNDIISFYKEERGGETANQISILAARTGESKLKVLNELTAKTIERYKKIVKILEGSPLASEVFKRFVAGYVYFHTSPPRYRMQELGL